MHPPRPVNASPLVTRTNYRGGAKRGNNPPFISPPCNNETTLICRHMPRGDFEACMNPRAAQEQIRLGHASLGECPDPCDGCNSTTTSLSIGDLVDVDLTEPGNRKRAAVIKPGDDLVSDGNGMFILESHKITICHNPEGPSPQTIVISAQALQSHLDHGDTEGICPDCFCSLDELEDTDMIDMATNFDHLAFNVTGTGKWKPHDSMSLAGTDAGFMPNGNTLEVVGTTNLGDPDSNTASGLNALTAGINNIASGIHTVALGNNNRATGAQSAAIGGVSIRATGGQGLVAGGFNNLASGFNAAVVGGANNQATNQQNFVGGGFFSRATGAISGTLSGQNALASGTRSGVVSGLRLTSSGLESVASGGRDNLASASHTAALGGICNVANVSRSSVLGSNTLTGTTSASHAVGQCNDDTGALFMVGNGVETAPGGTCGCGSRSNALEVAANGDLTIAGDLNVIGSCGKCGGGGGGGPAIRFRPPAAFSGPSLVTTGVVSFISNPCPVGSRVVTGNCAFIGGSDIPKTASFFETGITSNGIFWACAYRSILGTPTTISARAEVVCEVGPLP